MSKDPEIIRKHGKKQPFFPHERTFNTKAQMQAYIVDRMSTNKNKRFNLHFILT